MQQTELFPVPNPCVGVCQSNTKGYCVGCLRSRTERQKWNDFMPAEKMRVIELCDLRRAKLKAAILAKKEKEAMLAKGLLPPDEPLPEKSDLKSIENLEFSVPEASGGPETSLDLF